MKSLADPAGCNRTKNCHRTDATFTSWCVNNVESILHEMQTSMFRKGRGGYLGGQFGERAPRVGSQRVHSRAVDGSGGEGG